MTLAWAGSFKIPNHKETHTHTKPRAPTHYILLPNLNMKLWLRILQLHLHPQNLKFFGESVFIQFTSVTPALNTTQRHQHILLDLFCPYFQKRHNITQQFCGVAIFLLKKPVPLFVKCQLKVSWNSAACPANIRCSKKRKSPAILRTSFDFFVIWRKHCLKTFANKFYLCSWVMTINIQRFSVAWLVRWGV